MQGTDKGMSVHHDLRNSRAAFALIELLVVIAVIALLIGILLPSLGAAPVAARTTACASGLRQIGLGLVGYANDFRGFYGGGPLFSCSDTYAVASVGTTRRMAASNTPRSREGASSSNA